jgi:hypothetical protein
MTAGAVIGRAASSHRKPSVAGGPSASLTRSSPPGRALGGSVQSTAATMANDSAFKRKAADMSRTLMTTAPMAGPMMRVISLSLAYTVLAGPRSDSSRTRDGR